MPPLVTKQRPAGNHQPDADASAVLKRIAPLRASKIGRMKVSLYGMPKTGKTRLACTFPKPLLLIGAEDGTASVVGTKGVDFVQLAKTEELRQIVEGPVKKGQWATVVVDTATKLRDIRVSEIWMDRGGPIPERKPFLYADKAWKEVWVQCANDMRDMLRPLLDLPNKMDLNVVVIAQEQNFTDEDATSSSDLIRPAIGSAVGKSVCLFINAECDYIGQTFIREGMTEKTVKIANKETTTRTRTGKMEFCLRVGAHPIYISGFRIPIGAPDPPDILVSPSYDAIVKLIRGG